ncbi:MAG: DegT/DnrJ/EryC1/StrS family aminotransferase [Acidobacteriota bacterium]
MLKSVPPDTAAPAPTAATTQVPFFRPDIGTREIDEVVAVLRSGWLTTGPKVRQFEREFATAVNAPHTVAVNSCTAALHLAIEALGLRAGQRVLVPTMTFAATAEVLHYIGAVPVLVDCDPVTFNLDLDQAEKALERDADARRGAAAPSDDTRIVGIMPVHVGGLMIDCDRLRALADQYGVWIVEDAAHAFPAAWRKNSDAPWQRCGDQTGTVTAFSFYANKTITTGEGGMAATADAGLADRMRLMSLHGLTNDAWDRYRGGKSWDYRIVAPGYKYNLTDVAAAIGIHQLSRAEEMRQNREAVALAYLDALSDVTEIELPPTDPNRIHSWHLFPVRLRLDTLSLDRDRIIDELRDLGIGCSVHWRPLHCHPYYQERFGLTPESFPTASAQFERVISIPIFSSMTEDEVGRVIESIRQLTRTFRR